ncbi:hypothetical protein [Malaciobacter mytili]|uniref:hypothetical protein n=1 Tax=Malaciobacter mytili TaxID=603050 RepID=UPI003A8AC6B9
MAEQNSTKNSNEIVDEIKLEIEESSLDDKLSIDEDANEIQIEESQLDKDKKDVSEKDISEYAIDEDELKDYSVQKKQTKVQRILTAVIAVLLVVLTIGIILYITGFFDKKEEPKVQTKVEEVKEEKTFDFKSRDIDSDKLNKKFDRLTKYDPSLQDQLAKEEAIKKAKEEEERKALEEKKKLEEIENLKKELEAEKKALEEKQSALISEKEQLEQMKEKLLQEVEEKKKELEALENSKEQTQEEVVAVTNEEEENKMPEAIQQVVENSENTNINTSKSFLPLINVSVIKGNLKKDYLAKIERIDKNILLCRDNQNNIEIYVGPYEMPSARNNLLNKFLDSGFNEAMLIDLTKEEFDKRCNY